MKLFYSGAKEVDGVQFTPDKSLGGFISSTVIPNGRVQSIFTNFSNLAINQGSIETKGIFLKNTFTKSVKDIIVYCVYPDNNQVEMKLAAVVGNEMELLRSPYDTPYYSTFYNVDVIYSYTDIKIIGNFFAGESVSIEGVSVPVPDGKIETFITNAIKAFQNNVMYEVIKIDDSTIRLQYRILGVYTNTPVITSYYPNVFSFGPFANGLDNSQLIANELKPGESIGIWLQRNPKGITTVHTAEYYKQLYDEFVASNYGIIQNTELENIKFCIEWTPVK